MNYQEIKQLINQAQAIGLKTVADLVWFKQFFNCKTNNDLLNNVNVFYCLETEVAARTIQSRQQLMNTSRR